MTGKNLTEEQEQLFLKEAQDYFKKREKELGGQFELAYCTPVTDDQDVCWGLRAAFMHYVRSANKYNIYQSIFVFEPYRNSGHMSKYVKSSNMLMPFITMDDCNIESWFQKKRVPYLKVYPCGK